MPTGRSSRTIVLDFDHRSGGFETYLELVRRHPSLTDTVMVDTGNGRHLYFRHPGGSIRNRTHVLPGVDIRGDGGYVVVPPSVHRSGTRYSWVSGHGLADREPADFPCELSELLTAPECLCVPRSDVQRLDGVRPSVETTGPHNSPEDDPDSSGEYALSQLSPERRQRLIDTVQASIPSELKTGIRNQRITFDLARELRWGEFSGLDSASRRVVFAMQFDLLVNIARAQGIRISASKAEHIKDCEYGFRNTHTPPNQSLETVLAAVEDRWKDDVWEPALRNAIQENCFEARSLEAALLLICHCMHEFHGGGVWFASYGDCAKWVARVGFTSVRGMQVQRILTQFTHDGILRIERKGTQGTSDSRRATEWQWCWVPSNHREQLMASCPEFFTELS